MGKIRSWWRWKGQYLFKKRNFLFHNLIILATLITALAALISASNTGIQNLLIINSNKADLAIKNTTLGIQNSNLAFDYDLINNGNIEARDISTELVVFNDQFCQYSFPENLTNPIDSTGGRLNVITYLNKSRQWLKNVTEKNQLYFILRIHYSYIDLVGKTQKRVIEQYLKNSQFQIFDTSNSELDSIKSHLNIVPSTDCP